MLRVTVKTEQAAEPTIYHFDQSQWGFGDRWAMCNYILRISEETGCKTLVSDHCRHDDVPHIMNNLASQGSYEFVSPKQTRMVDICDTYRIAFCPTKPYTWKANKNKLICYQLDGQYRSQDKNLNAQEHASLFYFLQKCGYEFADIGHRRFLNNSIRLLSRAEGFIGIPSGMSHVANSVGTPSFIICKPSMDIQFHKNCWYYRKTNVHLFNGVSELTDYFFTKTSSTKLSFIPML